MEKRLNRWSVILSIVGMILIYAYNDTNKVWVAFGGGLVLGGVMMNIIANPIPDDDDDYFEEDEEDV